MALAHKVASLAGGYHPMIPGGARQLMLMAFPARARTATRAAGSKVA